MSESAGRTTTREPLDLAATMAEPVNYEREAHRLLAENRRLTADLAAERERVRRVAEELDWQDARERNVIAVRKVRTALACEAAANHPSDPAHFHGDRDWPSEVAIALHADERADR